MDFTCRFPSPRHPDSGLTSVVLVMHQTKPHRKYRSAVIVRFIQANACIVTQGNFTHNRKAKTTPVLATARNTVEPIKDMFAMFKGNPRPIVLDDQFDEG